MKRYAANYCQFCAELEPVVRTMPTSLAGGFPVHWPSGAICTKYVQPYYVKGARTMTVKRHGKPEKTKPPSKPPR